MKQYISSVLITISLLTLSAQAETVTYTDFVDMQNDIESLNSTVTDQQALVSKLSDDIGLMADRILEMADRIVETEKLLADTLVILTTNPDFAGTSSSNGVFLTSPMDGDTITSVPAMAFSPSSTVYLIYASTVPTFSSGNTISLYVDSTTALSSKWSQIVDFAGTSEVYLAVKRIDGSVISSISNGVKVSIQQ